MSMMHNSFIIQVADGYQYSTCPPNPPPAHCRAQTVFFYGGMTRGESTKETRKFRQNVSKSLCPLKSPRLRMIIKITKGNRPGGWIALRFVPGKTSLSS
ncbi:hypothetical protein CGRA01v4_14046 [Colletotrichum graminicola]|nr:hypothetical protein CGRA01v4_14046 [Colletotrichum graminicola]